MDQRDFNQASAFSNKPSHAYPQAPLSRHLPVSHYPYQQFLQAYQATQPYLLPRNQVYAPGYLPWRYPDQQRFNGITASGTGQAGQTGQTMAGGNGSHNCSSIPSRHDEDLISFDDPPATSVQNPRLAQQTQPLSQQPTIMRASTTMAGSTSWNHPASMETGGNWQYRMDDTIHQVYRSEIMPQYRSVTIMPGQQNAAMSHLGNYHNSSTYQQPMNPGYYGSQPRILQLPPQQASTIQGVRSGTVPFSGAYKPFVVPGYSQHGLFNHQSGSSANAANIRSNTSAQNTNPQSNSSQSAMLPALQKRDNNTGIVPIAILSRPKGETIVDVNRVKQAVDPSSMTSKLDKSTHQLPEKSVVTKSQSLKAANIPSGPRLTSQQKQTNPGRGIIPRRRSNQNKVPVSHVRTILTQDNSSKNIGGQENESLISNVITQEQSSKRTVRTTVFNTGSGNVTQGPGKQVTQSTAPLIIELEEDNKLDSTLTKNETVSSSGNSTQQSHQITNMPSTIGTPEPKSEKRLLSFNELFGGSNNELEMPQGRLSSPALEAIKDRPPSLYELMQLRNAATAAKSESSISSVSRSSSPYTKAEVSESSKAPSEQTGSPIFTTSLVPSQSISSADQDVATPIAETYSEANEPIGVQDPSDLEIKPTSVFESQDDAESSSRPSSSGDSTAMEPNDGLVSESVISTNTESTYSASTTPALIAKLNKMPTDPFPCRFCPDEYRTIIARDQHEVACRRKAGWPKSCCFCGTILSNRDELAAHIRGCSKSRGEVLGSASLSRYVASYPASRNGRHPSSGASPAGKALATSSTQTFNYGQDIVQGSLRPRRRRGARGKSAAVSSGTNNTGFNRGASMNKTQATTAQTSVSDLKATSIGTSSPTSTRPSSASDNAVGYRSRRCRRRGARKTSGN